MFSLQERNTLKTSCRLGRVAVGAHEVNRGSVMASQNLGQAGLEDIELISSCHKEII